MSQEARVIVAVAAEGEDKYIWSRLEMLPELFAAGPVAIRVGFFGAEGARSSRPFMVSRWTTNPADLVDLLQKARTRCICGCYVKVSSILEQALRETQQGPLQAVVIIGDFSTATLRRRWRPPSSCARPGSGFSCSSKAAPLPRSRHSGGSLRQRAARFFRSIRTSRSSQAAGDARSGHPFHARRHVCFGGARRRGGQSVTRTDEWLEPNCKVGVQMTAPEFQKLVTLTNRVAAKFNGSRDTCVLTSFALNNVLQRLGYSSRPLRIEAAVFPDDRKFYGTILGSLNGCRRAATPGMW